MARLTFLTETLTDAGATYTVDINNSLDIFAIVPASNPLTMLGNTVVNFSGTPLEGQEITIGWGEGITIGANSMTVNGIVLTALQALKEGYITFTYLNGAWGDSYSCDLKKTGNLSGAVLSDGSVTLAKLSSGTSGRIIVFSAGGVPTEVAMSGDATIVAAGTLTIANSAITNAKVDAAAAIARTKLANGTASYILANSGAGVMSEQQYVTTAQGGFGTSMAGATGFTKWAAGTLSVSAISEVITLMVSFEAAGGTAPSVGDFKIKMPYAGTVTEIYAYATKAIAATDNGTIQAKDGAGVNMTNGLITFTASDARGTAYTVTPTANNTFVDTDILTFTTAKVTAGGVVQLSIKITRTA